MKVKRPPHILRTISPEKIYTMSKRTSLFRTTPSLNTPAGPFIDKWGRMDWVTPGNYCIAIWRQADPISEKEWSGYGDTTEDSHCWVQYSVRQYTGVCKGERVGGVDELKQDWFYILRTGVDNNKIKVVAGAERWDEIIAKGCKLLGYLPTGDSYAHCGNDVPALGTMPEGYPTQREFYRLFQEANGKSMSGI
jgi:hypothetical protein